MTSLVKKADKLYNECLGRLSVFGEKAIPLEEFGYKCNIGYDIDDLSVDYKAIGWINGVWQLVGKNNKLYNLHWMPLEQLCEIIDNITLKK